MKTIELTGEGLKYQDVIDIAENNYEVKIPKSIEESIIATRTELEDQLELYPEIKIYGTNRLHGDLKYVDVDFTILEEYQKKYIKVHNCGTGKAIPKKVVRAIMAIRLNSFAKDLSGMRWETIKLMLDMLNKDVIPVVLEEGSVGASGDLVPLAMVAAVMIGLPESEVYGDDETPTNANKVFEKKGLNHTKIGAKEAMGLTNGSNFIAAFSVFAIRDAENLIENASIAGALSLEAIRGEIDAFSELINNNRPHEGQKYIAEKIRSLIKNSKRTSKKAQIDPFTKKNEIDRLKSLLKNNNLNEKGKKIIETTIKSAEWDVRVQDRYSFRAIPQVHGVVIEAIKRLKEVVEIEINSATDNPLFKKVSIEEMKVGLKKEIYQKLIDKNVNHLLKGYSGANFHGQPLATVIDYLKIALSALSSISDKRAFSLLSSELSYGLPADLAYKTKKADGGLMIVQYAGAARVAENRVLSTPSSVMSVSTAANQEDFVSMGANGALHLKKVIENTEKVVAIELLCALRGIQMTYNDLPKNLQTLGEGTTKVYDYLSKDDKMKCNPEVWEDHYLRTDMEDIIEIVKSGELVALIK